MLSWLFCICFWKFKHNQLNFLRNYWRWFHSNHMRQLIMIIFPKTVSNYRRCSARMHTSFVWFIFSFLFCFFNWLFFSFCGNTSNFWNPEAHNFLMTYLIFIKQNNQNRFVKTEDSEIWNQNRKIYFKNTMELMWWNLCGSSTQIW